MLNAIHTSKNTKCQKHPIIKCHTLIASQKKKHNSVSWKMIPMLYERLLSSLKSSFLLRLNHKKKNKQTKNSKHDKNKKTPNDEFVSTTIWTYFLSVVCFNDFIFQKEKMTIDSCSKHFNLMVYLYFWCVSYSAFF